LKYNLVFVTDVSATTVHKIKRFKSYPFEFLRAGKKRRLAVVTSRVDCLKNGSRRMQNCDYGVAFAWARLCCRLV